MVAVVGVERRQHRVGERPQRVGFGHREQQPVGAQVGEPRLRPSLQPADLQCVARLAERAPDVAGVDGRPRADPKLRPRPLADRGRDPPADRAAGRLAATGEHPTHGPTRGTRRPARDRSSVTPSASASLSSSAPTGSSESTMTSASLVEAEPREAARGVRGGQRSPGELVEEVSLQPALRVGDRPRLGELDREQAERMPGHDAVELAGLLGLAHREERLDPALRPDGLDPDVVTAVDERDAERRPVGPRAPQLLPDPRRPARPRRARSLAIGSPCRSSSSAQPFVTSASEPSDALDVRDPSITARVSTCSASTARCSVSYCSATIRVKIASVIAMNGTG